MDPSFICTIRVLANGTQNFGSETRFTIDGLSKVIDSYYNSTMLSFTNVSPTPGGEITIDMDRYGSGVGIINLMQVDYAAPFEPEDSDADSLPDWWEDLHGFGQTGAVASATASNGVNTLLETYIAGLDPNNADSQLKINTIGPLQWDAVSGRVYTVYWTSNLLSSFQPLESNLTGGVYTDSLYSTENKGFYRIEAELE